jgi:hypothetical protein
MSMVKKSATCLSQLAPPLPFGHQPQLHRILTVTSHILSALDCETPRTRFVVGCEVQLESRDVSLGMQSGQPQLSRCRSSIEIICIRLRLLLPCWQADSAVRSQESGQVSWAPIRKCPTHRMGTVPVVVKAAALALAKPLPLPLARAHPNHCGSRKYPRVQHSSNCGRPPQTIAHRPGPCPTAFRALTRSPSGP